MPDLTAAYLPAWVPNVGRTGLRWGPAQTTITAARRLVAAEVQAGRATLGFVVRVDASGTRTPIPSAVYPESAARVVRHWLAVAAACGPTPKPATDN